MAKRKIFWCDSTSVLYYIEQTKREMVQKHSRCCSKICGNKAKEELDSLSKIDCLYCPALVKYAADTFKRHWKMEQLKLNVVLDNSLIMFENVGVKDRIGTFSVLGKNLGHLFGNYYPTDTPLLFVYYVDGYNVRSEWLNADNGEREYLLFRKLKRGISENDFTEAMQKKGNRITYQDVKEYTESILPAVREQLNF